MIVLSESEQLAMEKSPRIYFDYLCGDSIISSPGLMILLSELEQRAKQILPEIYFDYFCGGANNEQTLTENINAFKDIFLWPRMLRGSPLETFNTSILGCKLNAPIIAAPTAFHQLAHHLGELATARGIARNNGLMIISMAANASMEDIVSAGREINSSANFWFQLYIQADKEFTLHLVRRAEKTGCSALVVTVDSPVFGSRDRDIRNGFTDLPEGLSCPNMIDAQGTERKIEFMPELRWEDIRWLCQHTELPVVVKGILHPDDVELAIQSGAKAIMVSNHGGRQLDGAPPTIRVLPALAQKVNKRIPLILDGGVRRGTDILKALALGASAIAVGRPIIWGLSINGAEGVYEVVKQMNEELHAAMLLCGCQNIQDIDQQLIFSKTHF